MVSQNDFYEQIRQLTKFGREPIPSEYVLEWLNHNRELFFNSADDNSCSNRQSTFPCFCCDRKSDCLFTDIYLQLSLVAEYEKFNRKCKLLIQEYLIIENNKSEIENWLKTHLEFGINKLDGFTNHNNNKILRRSFINGKDKCADEFDYIILHINLETFNSAYEFKKISPLRKVSRL